MILFDLRCSNGHAFEGWFRDGASYDSQAKARAIACSICGDLEVTKALMAPALGGRARALDAPPFESEPAPGQPGPGPKAGPKPDPATSGATQPAVPKLDGKQAGKMLRALRQMQAHVESNYEHVGPRFAEEARKIHYGEGEKRSIYGEATTAEAAELRDEGIQVGRVPWLRRSDA